MILCVTLTKLRNWQDKRVDMYQYFVLISTPKPIDLSDAVSYDKQQRQRTNIRLQVRSGMKAGRGA